MLLVSATDIAIRLASERGTLALTEHVDRFGGTYIAIADEVGLIEVASDRQEADDRVAACTH